MTGGVGRISAEQFWTEQVRLTALESDPNDSEEGELWLREDVAEEDDQLATIRLDTGGSTVDIPVFDVGADVPDDVSTQLRLVVDGQQGFVPTVEDGGSIPQLAVWSDGVRHEAIEELVALPDGLINQYELSEGTGTTSTDSEGDNDLTLDDESLWFADSRVTGDHLLDFNAGDHGTESDFIPQLTGDNPYSVGIVMDLDKTTRDGSFFQVLYNVSGAGSGGDQESLTVSMGNDSTDELEFESRGEGGDIAFRSGIDFDGESGLIFATITHDGDGNSETYLNGDSVPDTNRNGNIGGNDEPIFALGKTGDSTDQGYAETAVAYVPIWGRELSADEVEDAYNTLPWS